MALIQFDKSNMEVNMSNLDQMVQMQTDIAADHITEQTEKMTFPYVPLKWGYLQDGFHTEQRSNTPKLQIDMMYDAYSNQGFDYAYIQHEKNLHHPKKGIDHYLTRGMSQINVEQLYAFHISKVL